MGKNMCCSGSLRLVTFHVKVHEVSQKVRGWMLTQNHASWHSKGEVYNQQRTFTDMMVMMMKKSLDIIIIITSIKKYLLVENQRKLIL